MEKCGKCAGTCSRADLWGGSPPVWRGKDLLHTETSPGKTGKAFELTSQILIGSKLELLFYEPQRKPQVSRLRQDRYKRGSSITLSLPAVSLFSETSLPDKVLTQLTVFLHGSHSALSPLAPPKCPSVSREVWVHGRSHPSLLLRQLSTEPCLFSCLSSAPSRPPPPPSCRPPEGSTRHCHGCGILTGNKWIKQILSVAGIQCGENVFPGRPQPFLGKGKIMVNNLSLGSQHWRSRTQPVHTWVQKGNPLCFLLQYMFFFFLS